MPRTLQEAITRAQFDARQARRRKRTMAAHRQARRNAIDQARQAEPSATDYFNAADYGTRLQALEARYALLRHARMEVVATMAHEGHNGSRAAMVRPTNLSLAETVNATEVRCSPRWTLDAPRQVKWPTTWDGACYSIKPGEGRRPFEPPTNQSDESARREVARVVTHAEQHQARMLAAAGTIRMGEQD